MSVESNSYILENEEKLEILASNAIKSLVEKFKNIQVEGRDIPCPFWMNFDYLYEGTPLYKGFLRGGKLSPEEVKNSLNNLVVQNSLDIKNASLQEIISLMISNGIGVDCSGFAYQCLREVYLVLGGTSENFEKKVVNAQTYHSGITKVGVSDLSSSVNSLGVNRLSQIKPGDFIVKGRHIVVIIDTCDQIINCVHASNEILTPGIHEFDILIREPDLSIFDQEWQEFDLNGKPYSETLKDSIKPGDGIRRLRIIQDLYRSLIT